MRPARSLLVLLSGCSLMDLDVLDGSPGGSAAVVVSTTGISVTTNASSAGGLATVTSVTSAVTTTAGSSSTGTLPYDEVVESDAPTIYLRFEGAGPALFDEVSQADVGMAVDAVSFDKMGAFEPRSGKGIAFDDGGHLAIDDTVPVAWSGVEPYTVELWFNPSEDFIPANTYPRLFTHETFSPRDGIVLAMTQTEVNAPTLRLVWERFQADTQDQATVADVPTTGFTHLVCTFDGTLLRIYVNGANAAEQSVTTSITVSAPVLLGAIPGSSTTQFLGLMDEVALYDHALSADRVVAHYQARLP